MQCYFLCTPLCIISLCLGSLGFVEKFKGIIGLGFHPKEEKKLWFVMNPRGKR
jgi:hypothetical protein